MLSHAEPRWEGDEVPRSASHAFLLIHCPFCSLHCHPVSPVLLLHHVQVRHHYFYLALHVLMNWNNSLTLSVSSSFFSCRSQQEAAAKKFFWWSAFMKWKCVNEGMSILIFFFFWFDYFQIVSYCTWKKLVLLKTFVLINCRFFLIWLVKVVYECLCETHRPGFPTWCNMFLTVFLVGQILGFCFQKLKSATVLFYQTDKKKKQPVFWNVQFCIK